MKVYYILYIDQIGDIDYLRIQGDFRQLNRWIQRLEDRGIDCIVWSPQWSATLTERIETLIMLANQPVES
jgi:hypothetical protein